MKNFKPGGCIKKKAPNPTNWQFANKKECKTITLDKLPAKVSLKRYFPAVYTQHYGSCTATAVLACDHYYYHRNSKSWVPSHVFTYYVSRAMMGKSFIHSDEGSDVETALDAVRKKGACNSKVWPNTKPFDEKPTKKAYDDGLKGKEIIKYYNVKSMTQLKKALHNKYPVAMPIAWAFTDLDKNYILQPKSDKEIKKCYTGHAIVIVGYDDKKKLIEFRNSWSSAWGNKGYGYISYDVFKKVAWWDDAYAVVK